MSQLATNLKALNQRIVAAAKQAKRNPNNITLVAVTKTHPVETVIEAYNTGLCQFGENRAAESNAKIAEFAQWFKPDPPGIKKSPVQWHFIGHIQSRQASQIIDGQYSLLHSVDSLKLAQRINRLAERDNLPPVNILLQCNVSGELTKEGFTLNNWQGDKNQLAMFTNSVNKISSFNKIIIQGLMTMAPWDKEPEKARPTFQSLAALKNQMQTEFPDLNWHHLSMGMTDDFEVAIEEGATIIRVGRAIFGKRSYT